MSSDQLDRIVCALERIATAQERLANDAEFASRIISDSIASSSRPIAKATAARELKRML
jgi:hypothetical protein